MIRILRKKTDKTQILEISGSLTAAWSADLKKEIQGGLKKGPRLQLVIKKVEDVDLSFLQVILAALKTAQAEDKELTLKLPVPDPIVENVILAGLHNHGACSIDDCLWCSIKTQSTGA
jgi:anti-anti-sigma regulatory factor